MSLSKEVLVLTELYVYNVSYCDAMLEYGDVIDDILPENEWVRSDEQIPKTMAVALYIHGMIEYYLETEI